jgi:hypothetical protein
LKIDKLFAFLFMANAFAAYFEFQIGSDGFFVIINAACASLMFAMMFKEETE